MPKSKRILALATTILSTAIAAAGPASAERGTDGELTLIYWQAPSMLNPYIASGTKEIEVASVVLEPLARYDADGNMVAWLVDSIPTVENGGVSEDLMSITWTLTDGITWSDGTPLTSEDVRFTWEYCMSEGGGCAHVSRFNNITSIDTPDAQTVIINFDTPRPFPYGAFVGSFTPVLQKAQFENCTGERMPTCTDENFAPIGTGPFVVSDFRPNDVAVFEANPNYRVADAPAFSTLTVQGGGDAVAAARSVFQTGEADYAWNIQISPELVTEMESSGEGEVVRSFGNAVEQIYVNLTDPSSDLGDARSTTAHVNPIMGDPAVREALSMAIDRALLTEIGYGASGRPTCNILPAPEIYRSTANDGCLVQNIDGANALLDEAGWIDSDGDGVRERDGVELRITFITSTNPVRQDFQALLKDWWSQIGIDTELRNIDASVYFGSNIADDGVWKFQADLQMFMNNFDGTDPESYMANYRCSNIPRPETQWQGSNISRFCSEDYDALSMQMATTGELSQRAELARSMNDMLMQQYAIIPLVDRGRMSARAMDLLGVEMNAWDSELWNIADWTRAE